MIPISEPYLKGNEKKYLFECIKTNYVSSVGPFVELFEKKLSQVTNFKYAVSVSSGTAALHLALLSCGVEKNTLVIMPTYTFIATANAISYCGAKPWLVDICPKDWNLNFEKLKKILQKETYKDHKGYLRRKKTDQKVSAMIPVFSMGLPIDFEKANQISRDYGLKLIVDAAAGVGSKINNLPFGNSKMDCATISFNGNKNITTGGGGVVLTNKKKIAKKVLHLSTTGRVGKNYDHNCIAYNYRMTNVQAAIGCAQIEKLNFIIKKKKDINCLYRLKIKTDQVNFFPILNDRASSFWLSGLEVDKKDLKFLIKELASNNIESRSFWKPIHLQKPYSNSLKENLDYSDLLWKKVLILPSSASLRKEDQEKVCKVINNYFKGR